MDTESEYRHSNPEIDCVYNLKPYKTVSKGGRGGVQQIRRITIMRRSLPKKAVNRLEFGVELASKRAAVDR